MWPHLSLLTWAALLGYAMYLGLIDLWPGLLASKAVITHHLLISIFHLLSLMDRMDENQL